MVHKMGTHHKAMITWNTSIAVRATKTHTGSQRMLHTPLPSKHHSCCVLNSHSGAKTHWTRGASTPPFVSVLMPLMIHVLTIRHTPVLGSHHPLDAPHTMFRRPLCRPHSSVLSLFQTRQNNSEHSMNHFPNAFPSTRTMCGSRNPIPSGVAIVLLARVVRKTRRKRMRVWFQKRKRNGKGYGFGKGRNGFVSVEESDRKEGGRANQRGVGKPHNKGTGVCVAGMMRGRYVGCEPPMAPGRSHMTLTEVSG